MKDRFKISSEFKEKIAYGIIAVIFLILFLGLLKLQVFEHKTFSRQSENNRIRVETIIPRRGVVSDRFNRVIIDNRPSYTVSLIPAEIITGITIPNLSLLLEMDSTQIVKRMRKNMISRYQPAAIKRDISFEIVAVLEEQSKNYPGVAYQMERVRQFDSELRAESFTGYVGEISENELERMQASNYHMGSIIGKKGLEKNYDLTLRGQEGTKYVEVNAAGLIVGEFTDKDWIPNIPGNNLVLSIDNDLQKACAMALDSFCCGSIVAMDPRSGEILAMVSHPGFDPNIFSSVIPDSLWQAILADSAHPLLNRPLTGLYPPASTVKFVVIGAGLEEGMITENSTFKPCLGGFQYGNRFFKCWNAGGHGSVNAAHSLEQSCDVYLYQMGLKLGIDKMNEYYGLCGFGTKTGVDLPQEAAGNNPSTKSLDKRYGKRKWTNALALNISIGQGELLITPLQLAQFFCGLANNGIVYQPHIVKEIDKPNGEKEIISPKIAFTLPFSQRTMNVLTEGMRLVVEGEHGTAKSLYTNKYKIGGKTGTAQNPHGDNHSWFAGVAPLDNPEIVVIALLENAGHGSEVAAPIVGELINKYMTKKYYPVDSTVIEPTISSLSANDSLTIDSITNNAGIE